MASHWADPTSSIQSKYESFLREMRLLTKNKGFKLTRGDLAETHSISPSPGWSAYDITLSTLLTWIEPWVLAIPVWPWLRLINYTLISRKLANPKLDA